MASKRKTTDVVLREDYSIIPATALRILACLIDYRAHSRDSAVKVTAIARAIDSNPGEVAFDALELYGHGFAALTVPIGANLADTSVYLETDAGKIREYVRSLESIASHLQGRAEGLTTVAAAMAGCCHRWSV